MNIGVSVKTNATFPYAGGYLEGIFRQPGRGKVRRRARARDDGGGEVLVDRQWYGSPSGNDGGDTGWTQTGSRGVDPSVTWEPHPNLEPFDWPKFQSSVKNKGKPQRHTDRYTHDDCIKRNARVCPHQHMQGGGGFGLK